MFHVNVYRSSHACTCVAFILALVCPMPHVCSKKNQEIAMKKEKQKQNDRVKQVYVIVALV